MRILAAAHESSPAGRCKIEGGEPVKGELLDISGSACKKSRSNGRIENGIRRWIVGSAAAFRHRTADASLHRGRDAQRVIENRKGGAGLGDGLRARSEG